MMSLLNQPGTGCQALESSRKDSLLRRSGLTLVLALFSWLSIAGCYGVASQNTPPGNGQLSTSPGSVTFGDVEVGRSSTQTVTLSNSGNASLTVSQAGVSGSGFATSGLSFPLTLPGGQFASLSVQFAPTVTGSVSGSVSVVSNASNSPTTIALRGNGVRHQLSPTPSSVSFGNVPVGTTGIQTMTLTNSGTANLNISQGSVTGAGFSMSGLSFPVALAPGQSVSLSVQFAPAAIGSASGSVSVVSNAPNSPTSIPLSGTGISATYTLSISPASLSFGNITTGTSSAAQNVTITDTGNSNVTISQISVSGADFSIVSGGTPVILSPSQSATVSVDFSPTTAGTVNGSISIVSNASGSPASVSLSGTGVAPVQHSVDLTWNASTSVVSGYNVYRGTVTGGPYTKINSSLVAGLSYTDTAVLSGMTYYYVATAVDSNNIESVFSNEVSGTIPIP